LVFAPMLAGLFIDPYLFDGRYIPVNLVWLSFFTLQAVYFKKALFYRIGALLFFVMGFLEMVHWIMLKGPITVTSILVMLNTHMQEALDFLSLKRSWAFLLLVPYTFLFIFSFKRSRYFTRYKYKEFILGFLFLVSLIFVIENAINERFARKGIPHLGKVVVSFFQQIPHYRQVNQARDANNLVISRSSEIQEQTIVLVLGESLNRNHMSLYGYHRTTTPRLDSREDIIVYKDVVSPYSNTINSLLSMLSESNLQNNKPYAKSNDILDVFSSADFVTYWISNQPPLGIWENRVTQFAKKANHVIFVNLSSNSSKEATQTVSFDQKLFEPFRETLYKDAPKKLIVLHLMGSHSSYKKRYPPAYEVFKGKGKKESMIAHYDNSVLYNDFVIDSLIEISLNYTFLKNDHIFSMIYISDHGENVFDELGKVGHDYSAYLPKANVEIPFLLWVSPGYKERYRNKVEHARLSVDKPFVADDLFHVIQDIGMVESEKFDSTRSILRENFDSTRQRILVDGKDYDRK
jgi:heptose-I-phosphate ethanolaminephosphotransferase